jgi:hypothetical protein
MRRGVSLVTGAWVLGLALGAWLGAHSAGRQVTALEWLVLAALAGGSVLVLWAGRQ